MSTLQISIDTFLDTIQSQESSLVIPPESYQNGNERNTNGFLVGGMSSLHPALYNNIPVMIKLPLVNYHGYKVPLSFSVLEEYPFFATKEGILREIQAHQLLGNQKGIVHVYNYGNIILCYHSIPYLIMRKYKDSLDDRTTELEIQQLVTLSFELAHSISRVHNVGLVHRDINPTNCFMEENELVLGDFGIADKHDESTKRDMIGTEGYSPLEQHSGWILKESDVWGFGVTYLGLLLKKNKLKMQDNMFSVQDFSSPSCFYRDNLAIEQVPIVDAFGGFERFRDEVMLQYMHDPYISEIFEPSINLLQGIFRPVDLRIPLEQVIFQLEQFKTYLGI